MSPRLHICAECAVPRWRTSSFWCALSSNSGFSKVSEKLRSGVSVWFLMIVVMIDESRPPLR